MRSCSLTGVLWVSIILHIEPDGNQGIQYSSLLDKPTQDDAHP